MEHQPYLVTDQLLEDYFLEVKVNEMMRDQRQLQRTIQATIAALETETKRFKRLKSPTLKHASGVECAKLKAALITDQARLAGMVCAQQNIEDYQAIPF